MSIPASGSTSYATPSDLLIRYDWRSVGQLVSDNGIAVSSSAAVALSPILTPMLQQAAGMVEAACTRAGNYVINPTATPPINDLAVLNNNSKQVLVGLVCDLAMWLIWLRRPRMTASDQPPAQCKMALEMLDSLASGERIFGILEHQAAGAMNLTIDTPADVEHRHGVVVQARRYFGRRSNQSGTWWN